MANKYSSLIAVIGLAATVFAAPSLAQTPAARATPDTSKAIKVDVFSFKNPPSKTVIAGQKDIDNLHVLKSKIAVMEARNKLASLERETIGSRSEGMQPLKTLPKVVAVFGQVNDFSAQLVFAGGTTRNAKIGQQIGSMRIALITLEEVLLKDANGIEISLPFATHLSAEDAIKESLAPAFAQASVSTSAPSGFSTPPQMPVFAGPLPLAKP